ncbi:hypothetical protein Tco_0171788 [Tanacetum coccineum]
MASMNRWEYYTKAWRFKTSWGAQGDREAKVFQVSNDDTTMAQRRLEVKQPEEKTNTDRLVKEQEQGQEGLIAYIPWTVRQYLEEIERWEAIRRISDWVEDQDRDTTVEWVG